MAFRRDPLGTVRELSRRYGDIAYFKVAWQQTYFLTHPNDVRDMLVRSHRSFVKGVGPQNVKLVLGEGLISSEGEFHRKHRRIIQRTLQAERIRSYAPIMAEFSAGLSDEWSNGEAVDVHEAMMRLALRIITKALLNKDLGKAGGEAFGENLSICMAILERAVPPDAVARSARSQSALKALDEVVYGMIEERRRAPEDGNDITSMLLAAQRSEADAAGLTDRQIRDELMTLLIAGHETTANALSWAWYLLSGNPEAEAKLQEEGDRVLGGRLPTYEDSKELPYTRAVFAETLRMYPSVYFVDRRVIADFPLHEYVLPVGSIVLLSPYVTQRDPRFFPDPERFRPERWMEADIRHDAYFPFSAGIRGCLGEAFAWLEGVMVLATIAQGWRMRLAPGHQVGIKPVIALRPLGGMPMVLERRQPMGSSSRPAL